MDVKVLLRPVGTACGPTRHWPFRSSPLYCVLMRVGPKPVLSTNLDEHLGWNQHSSLSSPEVAGKDDSKHNEIQSMRMIRGSPNPQPNNL